MSARGKRLLAPGDWLVLVVIFAIGAAYQIAMPAVADVSWLLDVNAKMLSGARLYVDVIETNPPMAVYLYTPAALLAACTGLPASILQVILTLGLVAGSLTFVGRILRVTDDTENVRRCLIIATFFLVVAPLYAFSEREHLALALMLPSLAIIAARADQLPVGLWMRGIAGLGAGIAISVKPHFALGLLLPAVYQAVRLRSWRSLFVAEHWLAGCIAALHLALTAIAYPAYFADIVPMLLGTYRQLKLPLSLLLNTETLITVGAAGATGFILGRDTLKPRVLVPLLAALGFVAAYFEQGKGWIYHLYPALALVFIVFLAEALPHLHVLGSTATRARLRFGLSVMLAVVVLVGLVRIVSVLKGRNFAGVDLAERINANFAHPRLLALSSDLSIGHPLVDGVSGTWVGTFGQQILTTAATALQHRPGRTADEIAALEGWIARDRAILARDIRAGRPDIILVDRANFPFDELMTSDTEAASLLRGYQQIGTVNDIDVLVPIDRRPARDIFAETVAISARPR
jgi:hypothetical protein